MKVTKVQDRFIKNKFMGYSIVKGKNDTGKTVSAVLRAINLENNYCLYEDDRILYLTNTDIEKAHAITQYDKFKTENHFYSLFSLNNSRIEFMNIEELIKTNYLAYEKKAPFYGTFIDFSEGFNLIKEKEFLNIIDRFSKDSKFIKNCALEDLYDEILWIKACNFTKEEYLTIDRVGRKKILRKNSLSRSLIFDLLEVYNGKLMDKEYKDRYDYVNKANEYKKCSNVQFTHIIVDDAQRLTRGELLFINSIASTERGNSITFLINNEEHKGKYSWLVSNKNIKSLANDVKVKNFNFKTSFAEKPKEDYMDKYKYINLKYHNVMEFNIDSSSNNREVFLDKALSFKEDELKAVPVFNEIAAGEPITIVEDLQEHFYLPQNWLERGKDIFILQVKGDSMIEKDICNGDLVVIKRQATANNNDIVAANLDGEATLKILNLNKKRPVLMPANPRYSEISLIEKEVNILGVAIGVIKENN